MKKNFIILLTFALITCLLPFQASAVHSYEIPAAEVIATVNFRDAASTSSNRIRLLQIGEQLDIIQRVNSSWLEVRDRSGQAGFVSSSASYIKFTTRTVFPEPNGEVISSVSFRTGPSTSHDRIRFLQKGERFWILERTNDFWFKITDQNDKTGYVSSSSQYVKMISDTPLIYNPPQLEEKPAAPSGEANAQVIAAVNFRTGPSTSDSRIRLLPAGELLWILEKVNDHWYLASDASQIIGYVSSNSQYIDTVFNDLPAEEVTFIDDPNAKIIKSVNFRTGPSTSHNSIRFLQAGESLWIMNKVNSYWYEAKDKNGIVGFVSTNPIYIESSFVEDYKMLEPAVAAEAVIAAGMKYLGTPYEFGSSRLDTSTFDCSDFVRQAFKDGIGATLPGDSRQQAERVKQISGGSPITDWRQLKRGDLMFFMEYKGYSASSYANIDKSAENVRHVGIYLGDGQVLHTYSVSSGGVLVGHIAGTQWDYRFMFGGQAVRFQ